MLMSRNYCLDMIKKLDYKYKKVIMKGVYNE